MSFLDKAKKKAEEEAKKAADATKKAGKKGASEVKKSGEKAAEETKKAAKKAKGKIVIYRFIGRALKLEKPAPSIP